MGLSMGCLANLDPSDPCLGRWQTGCTRVGGAGRSSPLTSLMKCHQMTIVYQRVQHRLHFSDLVFFDFTTKSPIFKAMVPPSKRPPLLNSRTLLTPGSPRKTTNYKKGLHYSMVFKRSLNNLQQPHSTPLISVYDTNCSLINDQSVTSCYVGSGQQQARN